jgi:CRISPR-associated protein Cmr3
VSLGFLQSNERRIGPGDVLAGGDVAVPERRTGIALDEGRAVKTGALYTADHLRLREDAALAVLFDREPGLSAGGTLLLGGEGRLCAYRREAPPELRDFPTEWYMSLVPLEAAVPGGGAWGRGDESLGTNLAASWKFQVSAGWDLAKGFHKPTKTWIPAGGVFRKKEHPGCIALGNKNREEKRQEAYQKEEYHG